MVHDMSRPATAEDVADILDSPAWAKWKMVDYGHWSLYLNSTDQTYLGRSYAWLTNRHVDRMSLSQLREPELLELMDTVLPDFERAVAVLWGAQTVNFEWLGNDVRHHRGHGHAHFIPRYTEQVVFDKHTFTDADSNSRRVDGRSKLPEGDLERIRSILTQTLLA
jgi:hypothetical protein